MAKAPTKNKAAEATGTAVIDWEKEMEAQAAVAAGAQRATGGGKFFSMQAGQLKYEGEPCVGNRVAAIVIAQTLENSYYDTPYDPAVPASPKCFAFGLHEEAMEPHSAVDNDPYFERQHDVCQGCPRNEWGSARTGKGKACANVQRLGLILAGNYSEQGTGRNKALQFDGLIDDEDHYAKAEVAFMKLPVMSVKNFASFVKQTASELKRPPHGVFVEIWLEPDARSQFKVMFEVIDKVPGHLLNTIMNRHQREQAEIDFPYSPPQAAEEKQTPTSSNNKLRGKKK